MNSDDSSDDLPEINVTGNQDVKDVVIINDDEKSLSKTPSCGYSLLVQFVC